MSTPGLNLPRDGAGVVAFVVSAVAAAIFGGVVYYQVHKALHP